jgi:chemotaxis protein CheD
MYGEVSVTHVIQGEYAVSARPQMVLTTVLGSCVAACLYDPLRQIGGMNHFLLPDNGGAADRGDMRFAAASMEQLINALLRRGAGRPHLRAKLFGGARILPGLPDIGHRNATAAMEFLSAEHIPCLSHSLGGGLARRVRFWPVGGRAQERLLGRGFADPAVPPPPQAGKMELF